MKVEEGILDFASGQMVLETLVFGSGLGSRRETYLFSRSYDRCQTSRYDHSELGGVAHGGGMAGGIWAVRSCDLLFCDQVYLASGRS